LGWLRLVHAPALGHLADDMALIPAVAALGSHPPFLKVLAASHFWSFYLGSIATGLCLYSLAVAQRWLVLSNNKRLRLLALLPTLVPIFIPMSFMLASLESRQTILLSLLQWPPRHGLDFQSSALNISLHFLFAAAVLYGSWRILRKVDI